MRYGYLIRSVPALVLVSHCNGEIFYTLKEAQVLI